MIPQAYITEWSHQVPWQANEQVEQDLVISRALIEIFSDDWLAARLAFRGGTALHKLYLNPSQRYSEDIDLVQIKAEPIKEYIDKIQNALSFLGSPKKIKSKRNGVQIFYHFESEIPPVVPLKLKIEINTREHFSVMGSVKIPFEINSRWFTGSCEITTYTLEELLGTKLRALYQRKKGRDLFDLFTALKKNPTPATEKILECYETYIERSVDHPPSSNIFIANLDEKMRDPDFIGDTTALLRPDIDYDPEEAHKLIKTELLEKI